MSFSLRWQPVGLLLLFALLFTAQPAAATTEFQKEFIKQYAKGKEVDKAFKKLVRKGKCYVCHQGKDDHKNCNVYGKALAEYLVEDDKKDKEKIIASLKLVADQSSDSKAEGSPTFGELIAEGKLPGGSIEDSKVEPPKAEGESDEESTEEKPSSEESAAEESPEEPANNETDNDVSES